MQRSTRRHRCSRWTLPVVDASRVLVLVVVLAVGVGGLPLVANAAVLGGAADSTLRREPQVTPEELGTDALTGLQYGDPKEGIDLIDPPESNNQGTAALELPLGIPQGRGGVQPDLTLRYDSSGGSSWLGLGWDLNVGEITVDTEFGVPRYDPTRETETYVLDGARLSPTAITGEPGERVANRADFTRQVDDTADLIIRHGTNPKDYWWEIRTKLGGIKWYGGFPDNGGPSGGTAPDGTYIAGEGSRDPGAILTDGEGNAYRWALSAERDVGINMMRYYYRTVTDQPVGDRTIGGAKQMYLERIQYTATSNGGGRPNDPFEDASYEVKFLRQGGRNDVMVSGRGGFLEVTTDLLRRVEVNYGPPTSGCPNATDDAPHCVNPRTYNVLAKAFNLNYNLDGPFGKALLTSVDQIGSDNKVYATNRFDYFDEVRSGGGYNGFSGAGWESPDDDLAQRIVTETMGGSALGSSNTIQADGHAYLGFGPFDPMKDGSAGGSITIKGGVTEATAELFDINGDQLPDKIWRDGTDIRFRLNRGGPGGESKFDDDWHTAGGISTLSTEWNIGVGGAVEAYVGASIQFSVAGEVEVGEDYFTDANSDGLPDLVHAGEVQFNRLDANGIPHFTSGSAGTPAPIESRQLQLPAIPKLKELEDQQRAQSPLQDTVRRWIAPFDGTISVAGSITLEPPPDPVRPALPYNGDGIRATVEHGGQIRWAAQLTTPGQVASPTGVDSIAVHRGDAVYFRLQSIDDGTRDHVKWDPVIQYAGHGPELDVNSLDYWKYTASKEFTLGGRSGVSSGMPLTGHVRIAGTLHKTRPTTDDVRAVAVRYKQDGTTETRVGATLAAGAVGDVPVNIEFDVQGPDGDKFDRIALKLAVDTPIDVTALSWTSDDGKDGPPMFYTSGTKPDGTPVKAVVNNEHIIQLHPLYDIDLYSASNWSSPQPAPVLFPDNGNTNRNETVPVSGVDAKLIAPGTTDPNLLPARVVFSVKDRSGYVCKGTLTIPAPPPPTPNTAPPDIVSDQFDCPSFEAKEGEPYWFDFTTSDPRLAAAGLRWAVDGVDDDDVGFHWPNISIDPDNQTVFPEPFRGWAFAGYNGDGDRAFQPVDPTAFRIDTDDYPDAENESDHPDGFEDAQPEKQSGYKNPTQGRSFPYIPFFLQQRDLKTGLVERMDPVWRGLKDNTVGAAGFVRSSRTAADDPNITRVAGVGAGGESVTAVRKVGVSGPTFSVALGVFVVGAALTFGTTWGMLDYLDMNGDSFPDVVAPGYIKYTGPRGAYYDGHKGEGSGQNPVARDITIGISAGFDGSVGDVNGNAEGDANTSGNTPRTGKTARTKTSSSSAGSGDDGTDKAYGYSIGAAVGVDASFTNPVIDGGDVFSKAAEAIEDLNDEVGVPSDFEEELNDVNGDGLPDKVMVKASGVWVKLNLGYDFAPEVRWAGGGLETAMSAGVSIEPAMGFELFHRGFSGGVGVSGSVDHPIYSWADINGDDILDRLRRDGTEIRVAFGNGNGIGGEVDYGNFVNGEIQLLGPLGIPVGEMAGMGETKGFGVGFDITIPIGPLCPIIAGCWIIVNPGVHVSNSYSSTRVAVADINGDGYADSLASDNDSGVDVQLNNHGRTNLLKAVHNPLGGTTRLDYTRSGNTVDQPNSIWNLSMVQVDDGRPGDGPDRQLTTFEYGGNRFSRLERAILGYDTVIERRRSDQGDGNPFDDPVLRLVERHFLNDTIFHQGLMTSEVLKQPDGKPLKETRAEWRLVNDGTNDVADVGHRDDDPAGTRFFAMTVARQRTKVEHLWYDSSGNVGENTWSEFAYDTLGNVTEQLDVGEPETTADDVRAITTWSSCQKSASDDLKVPFPCPAPVPVGQVSPLWNPTRCPTWTAIPATFRVLDAQGNVLRERNGEPDLCDNSSVTHLEESVGGDQIALTELSYDEWGSYSHIVYPANADGERVRIDYVYDDEAGHANVAHTTRSICKSAPDDDPCSADQEPTGELEVATATFESTSGRIASRTDANGQTTSYTYDRFGRISEIRAPFERATDKPTVRFDYFPIDAPYAWATARHYDAFHPQDTIDTVSFVDGIGRQTQTKQDASVFRGAGTPAADIRIVSGAIEFDGLGRIVHQWFPTEEALGTPAVAFNPTKASARTSTEWNLLDSPLKVTHPDNTTESWTYGFGGQGDFGAKLFMTTFKDRNTKPETTFSDARLNVLAFDDAPVGEPAIRTRYSYDGLGQLTEVVDNGGNTTKHAYDVLGRRVSTETPDGGLVEWTHDPAGNVVAEVDPNMRANGVRTTYHYDGDRLVATDHPEGTPDVSYTWGGAAARGDDRGNGTGRVIAVQDGARDQQLAYDKMGNIVSDRSTMLVHNLNDNVGQRVTYTTTWEYDTWGRMVTLRYPDGEVLSHDYDSGGLLKAVSGQKTGQNYGYVDRLEYDEFFNRRFQRTANGVQTEYSYEPLTRRLARQVTNAPAREIQDLNFGYDKVGNILQVDNQLPPAVPELMGAPSVQNYKYDPYYRLISADGTYRGAPNKTRTYSFSTTYDEHGNVKAKEQTDQINKITQKPTTYDLKPAYRTDNQHQFAKIGSRTYTYDPNGNFTGWTDDRSGTSRTVTWDATERVRSVSDQGSTTTYTYDESGGLALQRGPGGETAFVNRWYTVINGAVIWKHVWAGKDRVASQRAMNDGTYELFRYFLHKDLQGSTNIVTDDKGLVWQHFEYFPSGEQWVVEQGTDNRTPYGYAAGYFDEVRLLVNLGARWYEPREQFMYSPDPVLQDDPRQVIDDYALLPAYSYAESNPLRLVDLSGRRSAKVEGQLKAFAQSLQREAAPGEVSLQQFIKAMVNGVPGIDPVPSASELKTKARKEKWESRKTSFKKVKDLLEAKPLVEINFTRTKKGFKFENVKISPTFGKQLTIVGKKKKKAKV